MMEWSTAAHLVLPVGLGLLGFIEPCAIGSHMVVLGALAARSKAQRAVALFLFVATRTVAMGAVGGVVALIGERFITGQKMFWFLFGAAYVTLGAFYYAGKAAVLSQGLRANSHLPDGNRGAVALGTLFGLSVPACAAPLLFAVTAGGAGAGTFTLGILTMGLFGLSLSAPLLLVVAVPRLAHALQVVRGAPPWGRRTVGALLVGMGLWSIWFALFVDPVDWQMP